MKSWWREYCPTHSARYASCLPAATFVNETSLTYCSSDLIGEFDIFLLAKKLQDSLLEVFQEKRNMTLIVKSEES